MAVRHDREVPTAARMLLERGAPGFENSTRPGALADDGPPVARQPVVLLAERAPQLDISEESELRVCSSAEEIRRLLDRGGKQPATWIAGSVRLTGELVKLLVARPVSPKRSCLLTLAPPPPTLVPALAGLFPAVIGTSAGYRWLRLEELVEVLSTPQHARELIVGGAVDFDTETVTLVRGDFKRFVVPFSFFGPAGDGVEPDFTALAFSDYGYAVVLGEYEAAADGVLYEIDPEYRRLLQQRRREEERTFGASLRRLRIQKRLKQDDFAPLSPKTIARIERNEVERPHGKTLRIIADRLGVRPGEIATY